MAGKRSKKAGIKRARRKYAERSQGELRTVVAENPLTVQFGAVIATLKNEALNAASMALDKALQALTTGTMPNLGLISGQSGVMKRKGKGTRTTSGRRQELIFPLKAALDVAEFGEKAVAVLAAINKHKVDGVSLTTLEAEIGWPYSTVQSHVNKLVAAKAAEKRKPAKTAVAA